MRNYIFIIAFFLFTINSLRSYSQEFTHDKYKITGVFKAEGKTKKEIFASINKWIALNYNSAQNVVQLNDKESGIIIVKGINEAVYKNAMKEFYPRNKYMQEYSSVKFNHTVEINVKDNKFRVIYTLTDIIIPELIASYNMEYQYIRVFDMIDFTGLKQDKINNYNDYIEDLWKKSMIGKKKREKIKATTKPTFEEMNKGVIENIKSTMFSIEKTVLTTKKDGW